MSLRFPIQFAILSIAPLAVLQTSAQQIDLSLHATAVPDSFEIKARSTGAAFSAIPNANFTVRWEASAGGVVNNSDLNSSCGAFDLINYIGVTELLDFRYFVIILQPKDNLQLCPITSEPQSIGGIRIRELEGCRNVELIENAYTLNNNLNYYFSIGGVDVTGDITSSPISSGNCPLCVPPQITGTSSSVLPYCEEGTLDLSVTATGSTLDYAWIAPGSTDAFHYLPEITTTDGMTGVYTAIASNSCGSDSAYVTVTSDGTCIAPAIDSTWFEPAGPNSSIGTMHAEVTGSCISYYWETSEGSEYMSTNNWQITSDGPLTSFTVAATNECGTDTIQLEIDPMASCIPPAIDSIYFSPYPDPINNLVLGASVTGTFMEHQWITPSGIYPPMGSSTSLILSNAGEGVYTFVSSNLCGSDTAYMVVEGIGPCTLPDIIYTEVIGEVPCQLGSMEFSSHVMSFPPLHRQWWGPDGSLITTLSDFTLADPQLGWHTFVAINNCGSVIDSVEVAFDTDTTCTPPQILSISDNGPICEGEVLVLQADVEATGTCIAYEWAGEGVTQTNSPTATAPQGVGTYTLTMTNGCGSDMMSIGSNVHEVAQLYQHVCGPSIVDLDSLSGNVGTDGYWTNDGDLHSGIYDSEIDTNGTYLYHSNTTGCLSIDLDIFEWPGSNTGIDSTITVCSTDEPFYLFDYLGGDPDTGGFWAFGVIMMDGIYDPAIHDSHTYRYHINYPGCSSMSQIVVTELQATSWYSDQDNDGFGDPEETLMECDQPDGYVSDSSDNCPLLFGLIGEECDDGLATTINDVISEDCECVGEISTSIGTIADEGFALWPNPNDGDRFFLQLPFEERSVEIEITDAVGQLVHRSEAVGSASLFVIEMEHRLNAGSYFVKIISGEHMLIEKLVIER